jgi:hypothetical protein
MKVSSRRFALPLLVAAFGVVGSIALCWSVLAAPEVVRPLSEAELQATVGMQYGGEYCAPTPGCNGYPEPDCDTQCTYCDNWIGEGGICTDGGYGSCTQLPDHDCGTTWQGVCETTCYDCDMSSAANVGACGTVPQCQ